MQRQSLGSPTSKLHSHGGEEITGAIVDDDDRRKDSKSRRLTFSASSSSSSPLLLPSSPKSEKLIHLIPVLTLLCFLILYLNSHSPSQSDLAAFNGFKHSSKHLDSREIGEVSRFMEFRRGDVLAIRSRRNLQELDKYIVKSRPHRKVADF
ncbi:hypothetical protein ES319_D03G201800v1 [Gossypium barbadense]|uniref:Uncharacterized protein n=2 Tax=Gossypium TaxID=3633 RepID=A0A5J5S6N0_GOSBA|nr:hypothetical protein ES319_D03G201800v1 [Gossypium barbadense]TYG77706.1 hypothetical protein ES288_D03G215900v1 [Gossypium darwinii]